MWGVSWTAVNLRTIGAYPHIRILRARFEHQALGKRSGVFGWESLQGLNAHASFEGAGLSTGARSRGSRGLGAERVCRRTLASRLSPRWGRL